jgi:hypothetical protein
LEELPVKSFRVRPTLEALESRRALSTLTMSFHPVVYPHGMVGPVPGGSRVAAAGEFQPPPTYAAPAGMYSGLGMNTVGGGVIAGVTSNGQGPIITDVNYSVTGGALASQTWTSTSSTYTRTSGVDHPFAAPNQTVGDSWAWY